jgi:hypothetical protein
MTSPNVVFELRPPRLSTALYGASLVVAVALVVFALSTGVLPLFTVVFVAIAAGIAGYNTATAFSRVRAHADGPLEVRNRMTTRRPQRVDVDRMMVGRQAGFGSVRRVELLLEDGTTLHLVATETLPLPRQRRWEQQAAELRLWLGGTTSPYR